MIRVWRLDKLADSSNMSVIEGAKGIKDDSVESGAGLN